MISAKSLFPPLSMYSSIKPDTSVRRYFKALLITQKWVNKDLVPNWRCVTNSTLSNNLQTHGLSSPSPSAPVRRRFHSFATSTVGRWLWFCKKSIRFFDTFTDITVKTKIIGFTTHDERVVNWLYFKHDHSQKCKSQKWMKMNFILVYSPTYQLHQNMQIISLCHSYWHMTESQYSDNAFADRFHLQNVE